MTRPPPETFVDLVEVDGSRVVGTGIGLPETRPGPLARWAWWQRAEVRTRRTAALSLVAVVVAAGSATAALTAQHRLHRSVTTVFVAPRPGGLDALGCPVAIVCVSRPSPSASAVSGGFDDAVGFDVVGESSGTIYARYLSAHRGPATLNVVAQCRPGRAGVGSRARTGAVLGQDSRNGSTAPQSVDVSLATDYYRRGDATGCTVDVWCSYELLAALSGTPGLDARCLDDVERVGRDRRVCL